MSETIVIQGRECEFYQSASRIGGPWIICAKNDDSDQPEYHLTASGKWSRQLSDAEDWHPTEAAAREFALKHSDQPAGGAEASGCELAELLAEVERLTTERDAAVGALEMMRPGYMLLEDSVEALTAQLAAVERERDALAKQIIDLTDSASVHNEVAVAVRSLAIAALAQGDAADAE